MTRDIEQVAHEFADRLSTVPITRERAQIAVRFYIAVAQEDVAKAVHELGELDGTIHLT